MTMRDFLSLNVVTTREVMKPPVVTCFLQLPCLSRRLLICADFSHTALSGHSFETIVPDADVVSFKHKLHHSNNSLVEIVCSVAVLFLQLWY